jgi:hypothetical protein
MNFTFCQAYGSMHAQYAASRPGSFLFTCCIKWTHNGEVSCEFRSLTHSTDLGEIGYCRLQQNLAGELNFRSHWSATTPLNFLQIYLLDSWKETHRTRGGADSNIPTFYLQVPASNDLLSVDKYTPRSWDIQPYVQWKSKLIGHN